MLAYHFEAKHPKTNYNFSRDNMEAKQIINLGIIYRVATIATRINETKVGHNFYLIETVH